MAPSSTSSSDRATRAPNPAKHPLAGNLLPPEAKRQALVLASASPRRARILELAGIPFEVLPCPSEARQRRAGLSCHRLAGGRAIHKALWVAQRRPDRLVLGADTVVVCGEQPLGKPHDAQEAQRMLTELSGRTHSVYTAFALARCHRRRGRIVERGWEGSEAKFRRLSPAEIAAYVATGKPLDKAGGYAIQGPGRRSVEWIRGSYYNVVGLPIRQLLRALGAVGWIELQGRLSPTAPDPFPGCPDDSPSHLWAAAQMNRRSV